MTSPPRPRRTRTALLLLTLVSGQACDVAESPTAPTAPSGSVGIAPLARAIYIGETVQLEAGETLADGTSRPTAQSPEWTSDAPAVARVSPGGLLSAVAAGEATIIAAWGAPRATIRVRVLPDFSGTWSGRESVTGCAETGGFAGMCGQVAGRRLAGTFQGLATQSGASVVLTMTKGGGMTAAGAGNITMDGELRLESAAVISDESGIAITLRNWRSRADVPSHMTGTYELVFTASGTTGALALAVRLDEVTRSTIARDVPAPVFQDSLMGWSCTDCTALVIGPEWRHVDFHATRDRFLALAQKQGADAETIGFPR